MNILKEIQWAYQRVTRGYDDRIFWEFDSYFFQFIPAIKEFCIGELENEYIKDKVHGKVFIETLKLIEDYNKMDYKDFNKKENAQTKLWKYFGEHIGYYWN